MSLRWIESPGRTGRALTVWASGMLPDGGEYAIYFTPKLTGKQARQFQKLMALHNEVLDELNQPHERYEFGQEVEVRGRGRGIVEDAYFDIVRVKFADGTDDAVSEHLVSATTPDARSGNAE